MDVGKIREDNQKEITDLWNGIISMLPTQPRSFDTSDDSGVLDKWRRNLVLFRNGNGNSI